MVEGERPSGGDGVALRTSHCGLDCGPCRRCHATPDFSRALPRATISTGR